MPTILRQDGFRFYFYSHENDEPPHVHVDKAGCSAKFWIDTILLAGNTGFTARDLRKIQEIIVQNRKKILEDWYGYFS